MTRLKTAAALAIFVVFAGVSVRAKDKPAKTEAVRAKALDDLTRCRTIADPQTRLACFDQAAGAFDEAERSGDIVVVDKAQAREVKRQAFGLNLNNALSIFDHGIHAEAVDKVNLTIAQVAHTADGKWVITTSEGQVWRQIDSDPLDQDPKSGQPAEVSRGSLGSFFLKIGHDRAMRVHRDQ